MVVENRAGAGGNIAAEAVAKGPADGYQLLFGTIGTHGVGPALYKQLPFDSIKDFAPISLLQGLPNALSMARSGKVRAIAPSQGSPAGSRRRNCRPSPKPAFRAIRWTAGRGFWRPQACRGPSSNASMPNS